MNEPTTQLDRTAARALTDKINALVEDAWHLIVQAFQERAWAALGYNTWDDYCAAEFAGARLRLPRENRQEVVVSLREAGMSTRAIASATGIHQTTVLDDLKSSTDGNPSVETVTGVNGKRYQPTRTTPPDDELDNDDPIFAPGELDAINEALHDAHGDDLTPDQIEQAIDDNIESKQTPAWQPHKPDLGEGISHPARYSDGLTDLFRTLLNAYNVPHGTPILDPFAGTGRIHDLHPDWDTVGVELEPEWARLHERTSQGDACDLPYPASSFTAIVTSPAYGNRLADSHNAIDPERRRSYTHDLGRHLTPGNSGTLHWRTSPPGQNAAGSTAYRALHETAWEQAVRVLLPGGLFILNCSDHIRDGLVQPVVAWHIWALAHLGLDYVESRSVETPRLRQGANSDLRVQEQVHVLRKPA